MMRALALALAVFCRQAAADELAARVMQQLGAYAVVRADFVQERTVASMTRPVLSSGRMVLSRDDGLLWQVESPTRLALVFPRRPGAARSGAVQAEMGRVIRSILSGDIAELSSSFEVEARGAPEHWTLRLVPKSRELAQYLQAIHLAGGKHLDAIDIAETSGERTALRMRNFAVASELAPAERQQFSSP